MMPFDSKQELTPIIYGDLPAKVLHHITLAAGEMAFSLHWHDRLEFHRVRRGSLELFCADEHSILRADDVSVISPRMLHRGVAGEEGVEYDVIMFDLQHLLNQTAASMQFLKPLCDGTIVFEPKLSCPEVLSIADAIIAAHANRDCHLLKTVGDLYTLVSLFYRYGTVKNGVSVGVEERFGKVISYINGHFTEPVSSATLSAMFGYDEAYFCRKFKSGTGITVMKYIRVLRLEKARRMLSETEHPIAYIAVECGFADTAYFSNCFKKQYRMTATQVRETAKQGDCYKV